MSNDSQKSKVDSDLENRLDSLFDEDDRQDSVAKPDGHSNDPLDELKSLVMSIEWEITDDVMERFLNQIEAVKTRFEEDRIVVMFLQLLGSLGLYVKTNKGKAHPSAFRLLNSVYDSFEKAALPGNISPSEKKKLLYVELNKYKELKEKIDTSREPETEPISTSGKKADKINPSTPRDHSANKPAIAMDDNHDEGFVTRQYFDETIERLRSTILDELAAIRNDIGKLGHK